MNSEKEFKDKLKEKLSAKEFSFEEANWEQARQLIDASREEKKRNVLPFILLGLLFIGSGVLGFYLLNTTEKTTNKDLAVNSPGTIPGSEIKITNSDVVKEKSIVLSNNALKNPAVTSDTEQLKAKEKNAKTEISKEENKAVTTVNNSKRKTNKTQNVNSVKHVAAIAVANKKTQKQKTYSLTAASKKENKGNEVQVPETKAVSENLGKTIEVNTNIPVANVAESIKKDEPETVKTNTVKTEPLAETKPTVSAAIDSAAKALAIENPTTTPVHFISIEAGTNYLFGWNNPGKKDASGFNPVIGLNYSNVITKKTTLSFGIQYTMVRNLSYSNYVVTSTRYNFGEESDVMIFTPTTMHYLVAPVRLSYSLDQKNVFGLACNVGYLFNLNSNVELYSQNAGQKGNSTVLKTSGYTQGFKTFDTQLAVFYRRNLAKDLWLHAEFMYGLTDIKDNTFFKSNVKEKNTGLKLTLIYNLFKK